MSLIVTDALVTLAACDFEKLVQFYQQFLCQEPVIYKNSIYAEFRLPGVRLGIFRPRGGRSQGGNLAVSKSSIVNQQFSTGMALCLEVENLEAAIAHLSDLGYPPSSEIITASHGREIYAYDPEGNWLILHETSQLSTPNSPIPYNQDVN